MMVKRMTASGSILKETECVAVINDFFKILSEDLQEGFEFHSDHLSLIYSIGGVFTNINDAFDPERHQVNLNLRLGDPLKEAIRQLKVSKVKASSRPEPVLTSVFDLKSKTTNQVLTPGGVFNIEGDMLKIDNEEDKVQGVFFINTQTKKEYRAAYLYQNLPKSLQVELPVALVTGSYQVEVRTNLNGAKDLRKGRHSITLDVK